MFQVGGKITPSSMSDSVAAGDEIPVIFVRKFFHRTNKSHTSCIWHFLRL